MLTATPVREPLGAETATKRCDAQAQEARGDRDHRGENGELERRFRSSFPEKPLSADPVATADRGRGGEDHQPHADNQTTADRVPAILA